MEPIETLYERDPAPVASLPPELASAYAGGLVIPEGVPGGFPYVVANFVASLDGVTSYTEPGYIGGGAISGFNEPDHFVMGLLRARVDAVIFGSGTLHQDAGHVRVAPFVYPALTDAYAALRRHCGRQDTLPLNVVVSASGRVDLSEPTFHYAGLRVVIATTASGHVRLTTANATLPPGVEIRVVREAPRDPASQPSASPAPGDVSPPASAAAAGVDPVALLELLGRDYGVQVALHEGGPTLLAAFLAAGALDELFLTLAPQLVGRAAGAQRPALLEERAFAPGAAPWSRLLSVKRAGEHLLLRYAIGRPTRRADVE